MRHCDETGPAAQEDHRYPFSGAANPRCRIGVTRLPESRGASAGVTWLETESLLGAEAYVARVLWCAGGAGDASLLVALIDRPQSELVLARFDLASGAPTVLFRERSEAWLNFEVTHALVPLRGGAAMLLASERSGHRQLYELDVASGGMRALTEGDGHVDRLKASWVDERGGRLFCLGSWGAARERHLYEVRLDSPTPSVRRVTVERGMHDVALSDCLSKFVDTWSDPAQPYRVAVKSTSDGATSAVIFDGALAEPSEAELLAELRAAAPSYETLRSSDGSAELHMAIYEPPPAVYGKGPHPLVMSCYGGPHVQFVREAWEAGAGDMRAQFLASRGFLVAKVDNRGSARRGVAFESAVRHDLGHLEVEDQLAAVRRLVADGRADPGRVGIFGWSYGGYLSAMCLARGGGVFKAAVAGAPVTSWDGYDTCYTERYMGTPLSNPDGYKSSSVMEHAAQIEGSLLLVHGLVDENVHFRHTARLIDALIQHRKPHELLLFPSERHMPRGLADRTFMEERILDFLKRSL